MALCKAALSHGSDLLAQEMKIGMVNTNRYFCHSLVKVKSISTLMVKSLISY